MLAIIHNERKQNSKNNIKLLGRKPALNNKSKLGYGTKYFSLF